jgi:signal transduction histidine kinase
MSSPQRVEPFTQKFTRATDWLLVSLVLLITLVIFLAVTWTLGRIELQLKQQTAESLQTLVATTREGIELWVNSVKNQVSVLVRRPELVSAIQSQLKYPLEPSTLRSTSASRDLRRFLDPVLQIYQYSDFAVVTPDGVQIAGQDGDQLGSKLPANVDMRPIHSALKGEASITLFAGEVLDVQRSLIAAAPVRDGTNRIIAAFVLFLNPSEELKNMTLLGRPGKSGETYVFGRSGRLLTGSRFGTATQEKIYLREGTVDDDHSPSSGPSSTAPFTKMAQSALAGNAGVDVEGYRDYRGVYVLGAWSWERGLDIGIAAEIDRSEALAPYRGIRTLTLLMLLAIAISFLVLLTMLIQRARILASNYAFQQAAKARKDTMAIVSHDLRAPLNNVLLCSNMISAPGTDRTTLDRLTAMITRSGRQMEKLIADLLDVSEMEAGRLKVVKKDCEVAALLDTVRDTFSENAKSKMIEFAIACPKNTPQIFVDSDRIVQVLSNLVGNAIKFTPKNGKVSLNVEVFPAEVRFEIRDTGPGISEDELPHIFEQFWRAKGSERKGKGLGLYIAKMLVEYHGGKIWVETTPKTGSTFFFTIPHKSRSA